MFGLFNQKKIVFTDDKREALPLKYSEKNGVHSFKVGASELDTDDYNPRSQVFKFNTIIITPTATNKNRFVAYEILKDDVKLIKNYERFKQMLKVETSAKFEKALSSI